MIVNESDTVTMEEAAKLLHVSGSYVNALVDEGKLGEVCRVNDHNRLKRDAVLAYRKQMLASRKKGLNTMMAASERMGLYDKELEGLPVRQAPGVNVKR